MCVYNYSAYHSKSALGQLARTVKCWGLKGAAVGCSTEEASGEKLGQSQKVPNRGKLESRIKECF